MREREKLKAFYSYSTTEKKGKENWDILIWDLLSTYYKPETHLGDTETNTPYAGDLHSERMSTMSAYGAKEQHLMCSYKVPGPGQSLESGCEHSVISLTPHKGSERRTLCSSLFHRQGNQGWGRLNCSHAQVQDTKLYLTPKKTPESFSSTLESILPLTQ